MRGLPYWFFRSATLHVLAGMFLGIAMAVSGDHMLASADAHLNLLGCPSRCETTGETGCTSSQQGG